MKKTIFIGIIVTLIVVFSISGITVCQEKKIWGKENRAAHKLLGELQLVYQQVIELVDKALSEELGDPDELTIFKESFSKEFNPELMPEKLLDLQNFGNKMKTRILLYYNYWKQEEFVDESILEKLENISNFLDQISPPQQLPELELN